MERTWEVLFEEIAREPVVQGCSAANPTPIPQAVREAVVNAICHRDYRIVGQRIEIVSLTTTWNHVPRRPTRPHHPGQHPR